MCKIVPGIETMTSRERVIRTVKYLPVDRVPIDFVQFLARVDQDILQRLKVM